MTATMTTGLEPMRTRVSGPVHSSGLAAAMATKPPVRLADAPAGLPTARPQVGIRRVAALDRDPLTGKARRFIPW